jgi:uncharacterized MAPEG superfamily protein
LKLTPELYYLVLTAALTLLMWLPYVVGRILAHGLMPAMANPDPINRPDPIWAQRAQKAHANAAANLAVFAPLVIVAAMAGVSTPATVMAAKIYFAARLVHYVVYAAGIPVLRTLAFTVGFGATLVFVTALL